MGTVCTLYHQTLSRSYHGEWSWPSYFKPITGHSLYRGWLYALEEAQNTVLKGNLIALPVLLLCSNTPLIAKSYLEGGKRIETWREEMQYGDLITNGHMLARSAAKLGKQMYVHLIDNAVHDVLLSTVQPRSLAFNFIWKFLEMVFGLDLLCIT
eukprot:TRINITY_DN11505_c0_g1_i1.p1 TRINITY_DN11505_c0_g1~~TRINITY_DN11505_c0_g1_i1.p1  ORF type:complete len:154 (-),score=31.10 TRINITY_DN11505_c0_g1_i1:23-484(-)